MKLPFGNKDDLNEPDDLDKLAKLDKQINSLDGKGKHRSFRLSTDRGDPLTKDYDPYNDQLKRLDQPSRWEKLQRWWNSLRVDGQWDVQALLVRFGTWLGTLSPWKVFKKVIKWTVILGVLTFIAVLMFISYAAENEQMKQQQLKKREARQTEVTNLRIRQLNGDAPMTKSTKEWHKKQVEEAKQTIANNLDMKVTTPPKTTLVQINRPYSKLTDNYHMTAGNYIYWVKHYLPGVLGWKYHPYPRVNAKYDSSMHRLTVYNSAKLSKDQQDYLYKWAHHIYVNSEWDDTEQPFDMQFK